MKVPLNRLPAARLARMIAGHEVTCEAVTHSFVDAVGDPTRVIAGTDCGFDTSAGLGDVAASLVWWKLRALREGADLASARVF